MALSPPVTHRCTLGPAGCHLSGYSFSPGSRYGNTVKRVLKTRPQNGLLPLDKYAVMVYNAYRVSKRGDSPAK